MSSPSVTVIIPTYNWSSVLPFSIGSALNQSFSDFELLVIGDGRIRDSIELGRRASHDATALIARLAQLGL